MILRRSLPTPSELMTTAGLVLFISCPLVGFRSMSQISPRFGFWLLVLLEVIAFGVLPAFSVFPVVLLGLVRLRLQQAPALFQGQV